MDQKKAVDYKEALEIEEQYKGIPHGWIQWKATNVSMDLFCRCGCSSHVNGWGAYNVECPQCGTVYTCNAHIEVIELEKRPQEMILLGN